MKSFLTLENISARNMSQKYFGLTGTHRVDFCAGGICGLPAACLPVRQGRHGRQSATKSVCRSIRKFRVTHGLPSIHKDRTDENHRHAHTNGIFPDGVKYISATDADKNTGLTRGDIARLCTEKRVCGRQIGENNSSSGFEISTIHGLPNVHKDKTDETH